MLKVSDAIDERTLIVSTDIDDSSKRPSVAADPLIVLLFGPKELTGKVWHLSESNVLIGRSDECDIRVNDKRLSKRHALISRRLDEYVIEDLNSANGTYLNQKTIEPNVSLKLHHGDQFEAGGLIFVYYTGESVESKAHLAIIERALVDPLTGWGNRSQLQQDLVEWQRLQDVTGLLLFDVDLFKEINDSYGHSIGDRILIEICRFTDEIFVDSPSFRYRLGGDEFAILWRGEDLERFFELSERLLRTIEKKMLIFGHQSVKFSISGGMVFAEKDKLSWDRLYKEADERLYEAKHSGRAAIETSKLLQGYLSKRRDKI